MVSVLLVAALLLVPLPLLLPEPLLELEPEPAVQPAAVKPAATMAPYLVRRLMPFVLTADGPAGPLGPDRARSRWLRTEPAAAARARPGPCTRSSLRAYLASVSAGVTPPHSLGGTPSANF